MKTLIVGCNGQLGTDMAAAAAAAGYAVAGIDYPDIDITRPQSIADAVARANADIIVNCAAYTAVDACETQEKEAFAVNADGAGMLARAAEAARCRFVHFSTDYVFDGKKETPYVESDETGPATVYGKSKLEGERRVSAACRRSFILRIAWLYGLHGSNFVKTIRNLARKNAASGLPLSVVNDQFGSPTCTFDVCRQTLRLIETDRYGLYHATSEGQCSWYDFALEIVRAAGIPVLVKPCTTAEFPRPAPRPRNSVLENERLKSLGLNVMLRWEDGFRAFLEAETRSS